MSLQRSTQILTCLFVGFVICVPATLGQTAGRRLNASTIESMFARMDKNSDGKLDVSETRKEALHKRLDADKDGFVTLAEAKEILLDKADSAKNETEKKDVAYGAHESNKLDIYFPSKAENSPVMMYVHGGAWKIGDKNQVNEKASWFTERGWIFISANYRLAPEGKHPNNVDDVAMAFAWVHDNATDLGGDPDSLYLMGHSAGCHLVALAATDETRLKKYGKDLSLINGVIALDTGSFNIPESIKQSRRFGRTLKDIFGDKEASQLNASPIHHVVAGKDIPPFFVAYSMGMTKLRVNPERRQASEDFYKQLRSAGYTAELIDASDRTHREVNVWFGKADDTMVTGAAESFLKRCRGK